MKRKPKYIRSEALNDYEECPRKHHVTPCNPLEVYPFNQLKQIMNRGLFSTSKWPISRKILPAKPLLEHSPVTYDGYRSMFSWLHRHKETIVGVDSHIPMGIETIPMSVYVPYVLRKANVIFFVWIDFIEHDYTLAEIMRNPAVMAMYLCSLKEHYIDPSAHYRSLILCGTKIKGIRMNQTVAKLLEDQLYSIVKGYKDAEETTYPGDICSTCKASSSCVSKQECIDKFTEEGIFFLPRGKDRSSISPSGEKPKSRNNGPVRSYTHRVGPIQQDDDAETD